MNQDILRPRRSFLARLNTGIASLAAIAGVAAAQQKGEAARWEPARHDQDNWLDDNHAKHRLLFDSMNSDGLGEALAFASNIYMTNKNDYGLEDRDLALVVVVRHRSAAFGYNDAIWAKHGEIFAKRMKVEDPKTKEAPKVNLYNASGYDQELGNRGVTLSVLAARGAQIAVCQLSTRAFAGSIAKATGGKTEDVFAELKANLVPNGRLVPAGIVAVNRAQERGYTLMSL